ncbi:MAG: hypothetical protein Q8761_02970, partial [Sweet potato little leaf phytoplasma]|nr:hypothetical protein [Sweet potato little leaf phytoplasma]
IHIFLKLMPQIIVFNPQSTNMILFNFKYIHAHDIENFLNNQHNFIHCRERVPHLFLFLFLFSPAEFLL